MERRVKINMPIENSITPNGKCETKPDASRSATQKRTTGETSVSVSISLDGEALTSNRLIETNCGFLNHMLTLFAFHSGCSLVIDARGDVEVDYHHLTEDIGVTLGLCIKKALGEGRGVARYASVFLPMDETLVLVAMDISGRAWLTFDVDIKVQKVGDFDTELVKEFFMGLCRSLGLTLHIKLISGENAHHIIEAIFKGFGRAFGEAIKIDARRSAIIPSTKGVL